MRSAISLAELIRATEGVSELRADARARALGYEPPHRELRTLRLAPPAPAAPSVFQRGLLGLLALLLSLRTWWQKRTAPRALPPPETPPVVEVPRLLTWWRVEQMTTFPAQEEPSAVVALTREDIAWEPHALPPTPSLRPWRKLWPMLRVMMQSEALAARPDVPKLLRGIAVGEIPHRIPRARRNAWSDRITLVLDRSPRLIPFWSDQDEVHRRLRRVLRGAITREVVLDELQQARHAARDGDFVAACRGDLVLVLGDLGREGDPSTQRCWLRTRRRLSAQGARVRALSPTASRDCLEHDAEDARSWEARRADGNGAEEMLLAMVAMTCFCEPGLLRALRRLVPGAGATTELAVWRHTDLYAPDSNGAVVRSDRVAHWRARFAALATSTLANEVSACIAQWHQDAPPELLHAETLAWIGAALEGVQPPGDPDAATRFVERTLHAVATETGDPRWKAELRAWASSALAVGVGDAVYARVPAAADLKARVMRDGEQVPREVVLASVRLGGAKEAESPFWALRQVGDSVVLRAVSSERWPSDARGEGSPLATLTAKRAGLLVEGDGRVERVELADGVRFPLRGRALTLSTDRCRVLLGVMEEEPWMQALGRDAYGLWAEWELGGVSQRMRWIPGGVFWMGSPDDEDGRYGDEGPRHEVELTRGYWLGETPVTQALWSAVMGSNPSHFAGPDHGAHPVEMVSWDDCQEFIAKVNARVPGLWLQLPTEAEWERACRGGTDGPTWLGANDAANLDKIAWYNANSGGRAHPVRQKAANPFGLYDVLGNVLEWCDDMLRTYEAVRTVDPYGVHGPDRVYRGGSWHWYARFPRAALRHANVPSHRNADLGLRVAGGQGLRSGGMQEQAPRSGVGASRGAGRDPERVSAPRDAKPTDVERRMR